jgi:hypothetical protein
LDSEVQALKKIRRRKEGEETRKTREKPPKPPKKQDLFQQLKLSSNTAT